MNVRIDPAITRSVRKTEVPAASASQPSRGKKDDKFWREIGDDFRSYLLHVDHERIEDAGRLIKSIGKVLKDAGKAVRDIPGKVLDLPIIKDKVDEDRKEYWSDLAQQIGLVVGFTASGGHALAGTLKIISGQKQGNTGRKLDGLVDVATATTLALSVAGLTGARAIAAPIAALINIGRGGYNSGSGFKRRDDRKQIQGVLDAVRSAGSFGRMLKAYSPIFKVIGVGLAPVAGALQSARGLHDVAIGLRNDDNKRELKGLVDIATAVGTALAFASGVAIIPGVALAVAANLVKVGYQISPKLRKRIDVGIDKIEPKLEKIVAQTQKVTEPIVAAWKKFMSRHVKRVDASAPKRFSKAQTAEAAQLVHVDGKYARDEYNRLKVNFEGTGQKKDLPKRNDAPPALRRDELLNELPTLEERREFLNFLVGVSDYDLTIGPQERAFLRTFVEDCGLTQKELDDLITERELQQIKIASAAEAQKHVRPTMTEPRIVGLTQPWV